MVLVVGRVAVCFGVGAFVGGGSGGGGGALCLLGTGSAGKLYAWLIGVGHGPLCSGGVLLSVDAGGGGGLWNS